ncbi:hypothetical protein I312_103060 [Cryptococcus bacillisporus CA1280]|uniref:Uncharacterized protein n=1 Tax=Cryptococcus bacillisporus CA1280 TaxID=1296109 RepID=A0A0D0VJQ3_CRYGA|nr:hypothetical protein I312_03384 [Cryptococcus bacillisporus CA1280]
MAEDTPGRGVLHQQLQERLPMQGNDSRRDFYTMVEVSELSKYHVQWDSFPELQAVHLEYLAVYKVFRCAICSSNKASSGTLCCIPPKHLHNHVHQHLPHMAETELEDIMASVLRDYPLHQGRHPSVP